MQGKLILGIALALAFFAGSAVAQNNTGSTSSKAASKPSSRDQLKSKAKAKAAGVEAAEVAASPEQLDIAKRVLTGTAQCELGQSVSLEPNAAQAGYFKVRFKNLAFNMLPEPTTTGAVRLEDKKAGAVWIQIPTKSMLMNSKAGQRLADNCQHPIQKAATDAAKAAESATAVQSLSAPEKAPSN
jgi:hypothetical protein